MVEEIINQVDALLERGGLPAVWSAAFDAVLMPAEMESLIRVLQNRVHHRIGVLRDDWAEYKRGQRRILMEDAQVRTNGALPHGPVSWQNGLNQSKQGEPRETFQNLVLSLENIPPWRGECWYDLMREMPMCGSEPLTDEMVAEAALSIERDTGIAIKNLRLVQAALVHVSRASRHDPLRDWVYTLPSWDGIERLPYWLSDFAHAERTAYGMDVSRLIPVSMIARALEPGCQCRTVPILEGPEDAGKSKLIKVLASDAWYRDLSQAMEGKEAHMILQGVWVAELAELATMSKTEESRLKAFITMQSDDYIPKFSNLAVSRKRRTIFIGTVNPEGDGAYLRGQTGNTRFLPIAVSEIDFHGLLAIREQLFAEALVYYKTHPDTWWQLSAEGSKEAEAVRNDRRQASVYEEAMGPWLKGRTQTTWEEIAQGFLQLDNRERWKDKGLQMEIAKSLRANGWERSPNVVRQEGKRAYIWRPVPKKKSSDSGA